ncbi:WhiB family transcriptional regulator [Streptomyces samsunensis]|uniref:WhiB family transcriptional regulator n=1 Tax=Streptomyces malaysiensis TaxID=92644 RepID=UPI001583BB5C|nr:WhiB family transcriptional regulator [Streptomyces samsunensis]NUH35308.1 WhiB family transcriptional regulator [Streptomyces samsunensis]
MIPTAHAAGAWLRYAACRDADPELFFPVGGGHDAIVQANEAKSVCYRCPVMELCAEWALSNRVEHGVWGGLTEAQRRTTLRKRGRGTGSGRKKAMA